MKKIDSLQMSTYSATDVKLIPNPWASNDVLDNIKCIQMRYCMKLYLIETSEIPEVKLLAFKIFFDKI